MSSGSFLGFLGGVVVKNLPVNAGDLGSVPGSGSSSRVGNDNSFSILCLENSMDRGAWWATVPGVTKSQIQQQTPSAHTHVEQ